MFTEVEFLSQRNGARALCRGRLYEPSGKATNGAGVVLAHGLCGTMDSGLFAYAEAFAKAGFHALVFDYRGFGVSEGEPRQYISVPKQLADWRAAIDLLSCHDNVNGQRLGLWGISFSGGHVVHLAQEDARVRAIVGQVPMIDPVLSANVGNYQRGAAKTQALAQQIVRRSKTRWFSNKVEMLQVAPQDAGKASVLGAKEAEVYAKLAGPSWRNELHPDSFLTGKFEDNNPSLLTDDLTTPMLLQLGERDTTVSNEAIKNFARRCGPLARLTHYDATHFTMLQKNAKRTAAIEEAVQFYREHLIL